MDIETPAADDKTPAPDAPAEPAADAPPAVAPPPAAAAADEPAGDAPTPAADAPPDFEAMVNEWGGKDSVEEALKISKSLETEEGVTRLFIEAGRALGLGLKELDALFAEPAGDAAPPVEEPDPDEPLTVAKARELLAAEFEDRQRKEQETRAADEQRVSAKRAVDTALAELKVTEAAEIDAVLRYGETHIKDGDYDPKHIAEAIRKGKADYDAMIQKRVTEYLQAKKGAAEQVPGTIGGGNTAGGADEPEPQNMSEAIARARARLRG